MKYIYTCKLLTQTELPAQPISGINYNHQKSGRVSWFFSFTSFLIQFGNPFLKLFDARAYNIYIYLHRPNKNSVYYNTSVVQNLFGLACILATAYIVLMLRYILYFRRNLHFSIKIIMVKRCIIFLTRLICYIS